MYQGPGSWKREAYWDEYVISLRNPGKDPVVLSSATLQSLIAGPTTPGEDPWKLDRAGKSWWQTNAGEQTKTYLMLGAGTVASAGGVFTIAALSGGILTPLTGGAAFAAGAGAVAAAALPVVAIGSVAMNVRRKHQIEAEFTRRRLVLPLTLAPGQTVQGSLFFRISPAPQRLELQARAGDQASSLTFDLAPLATLHLRAAPER